MITRGFPSRSRTSLAIKLYSFFPNKVVKERDSLSFRLAPSLCISQQKDLRKVYLYAVDIDGTFNDMTLAVKEDAKSLLENLVFTLLSSACGRIKRLPCVCASVRSSRFCINLNILFIYKDIFTKFAGNVYSYENLSLQNFSRIWKNKMAAIANCLKIIKVL